MLMSKENFGNPSESVFTFIVSLIIFFMSFVGTRVYKIHPIFIILLCGLAGLAIY
jgi:chromate transporter